MAATQCEFNGHKGQKGDGGNNIEIMAHFILLRPFTNQYNYL